MAMVVKLFLCGLLLVMSSGWGDCTSVSIVLSSADENVTVRSTVLLVCVAYGGTNAPNIVWYRNGRPVNNATDLRYTVYDSTTTSSGLVFAESILEICSIGLDEAGDYVCNASSASGDSSTTNTTTLTVMERGEPDRPCNCSSVPVYSETGALISVEFNWTVVASPPAVVAGVNPNITSYSVSVNGLGAHIVPVERVCIAIESNTDSPMPQCTYSYPVPSFKMATTDHSARHALLDGKVAAVNEIGQGRTCSPSVNNIGEMNSYMTLSVDAAGGRVTCTKGQGLLPGQTFWCDFCYGSCQDSGGPMSSCSKGLDGTTILPTLSEGTYCYRATAVVDQTPAAVVQDAFNIRHQATATQGGSSVGTLAASVVTSFIAALIIGLLVGCLPCLCYYRQRSKEGPQRVCFKCASSTAGVGGSGIELTKEEIALYEHIPSMPQKEKDINTLTNEAYGKLPNVSAVNAMW